MVAYREILPGFQVFDCGALRAALSPAACADNWRRAKCLACVGCKIGAQHAGEGVRQAQPTAVATRCIRCGKSVTRIIGGIWCASCYNRTREVAKWSNARGDAPAVIGTRLRPVHAIITSTDEAMRDSWYGRPGIRAPSRQGLPLPQKIGDGAYWVEAIMSGDEEFAAYLAHVLPGARVEEIEIGPAFADMHATHSRRTQ